MEKVRSKKEKLILGFTVKQFVWFIFSLLLIAFGIIFLILGLIDDYGDVYGYLVSTPNTSMKNQMGGIGFTYFGVIVILVGSFILAFSMSLSERIEDREREKEARKKQRIRSFERNEVTSSLTQSGAMNSSFAEEKQENKAVE